MVTQHSGETSRSCLARIVWSAGLLLAYAAASFLSYQVGRMSGTQSAQTSIIAASWSEGTTYPVWYGAIVWTEWNAMDTVDVYAEIMIGKPPDSAQVRHHVGLLATEPTPEAAIRNWGEVVWTDARRHVRRRRHKARRCDAEGDPESSMIAPDV